MKNFKKYFLLAFTSFLLLLQPLSIKAGFIDGLDTAASGTGIPTGNKVEDYIIRIINGLLSLVGLVFIIIIILGGFKWMTSQGNSTKVDEAKNLIKNGIIGISIIILSYTIVYTVYTIMTTSAT